MDALKSPPPRSSHQLACHNPHQEERGSGVSGNNKDNATTFFQLPVNTNGMLSGHFPLCPHPTLHSITLRLLSMGPMTSKKSNNNETTFIRRQVKTG